MISYRLLRERIVHCESSGALRPGTLGPGEPFAAHYYATEVEDTEYLALVRGDVRAAAAAGQAVLVRVQSMCPVGDPFRTRPELRASLEAIDRAGLGVFLYVYNKRRTSLRRAFERQLGGATGVAADRGGQSEALRDFGLGAQILADLGLRRIRLLSAVDRKLVGLEGFGIELVDRVPFAAPGAPPTVVPLRARARDD
jgi:3,4-dihydroxy 2-butanone 4-phosphate synthase/GTP cyclohydrolase II